MVMTFCNRRSNLIRSASSSIKIDDLEKEGDGWDRMVDIDTDVKESCISFKAKQLVDIILSTLREAGSLSENA